MIEKMIDSWKDLPVVKFRQLMDLPEGDDEERLLKMMAIVDGTTVDGIMSLPLSEFAQTRARLSFLNEYPPVIPAKRKYVLNGTTYLFTDRLPDITVSQFVDWTNTPNTPDNMALMLSYVLVPEGYRYNEGYDRDKVRKDIDEYMGVLDARAVSGFFLGSSIRLAVSLRRSLRKTVKRLKKEGQQTEELEREISRLSEVLKAFGYSGR